MEIKSITSAKHMGSHIDTLTFFFYGEDNDYVVGEIETDDSELYMAFKSYSRDGNVLNWIEIVAPEVFTESKRIPEELRILVDYKDEKNGINVKGITLQSLCKELLVKH